MMITKTELDAIDDWQISLGLTSRAEAVRRLCAAAMLALNGLEKLKRMSEDLSVSALDDREHLGGQFRGLLDDAIDGKEHGFSFEEAKELLHDHSDRAYWQEQNSRYINRVVAGMCEAIDILTQQKAFTAAQREANERLEELNEYIDVQHYNWSAMEQHHLSSAVMRTMTEEERSHLYDLEKDDRLALIADKVSKYRNRRNARRRRLQAKVRKEDERMRETIRSRQKTPDV
ncbi:MAG: hypothetical protein E5V48_02735 [Mesorhizobium sp.]|nr:MAG: hypothetical protein E5V48_02735 [Mesorhizobium sp.]